MTNMMDVFTQIQCINCNCMHFVVLMIMIVMSSHAFFITTQPYIPLQMITHNCM